MRRVPLTAARRIGKATRIWRGFTVVYILVMFILMPVVLWGLSTLFEQKSKGLMVLGVVLIIMVLGAILWFVYWWRWTGGQQTCLDCMGNRQARSSAVRSLPKDMEYLKKKVDALIHHTGLPDEEEEECEEGAEEAPLVTAQEKKVPEVAPACESTSDDEEEVEDREVEVDT
jgi:sodium-dependent phosphate cotransporter